MKSRRFWQQSIKIIRGMYDGLGLGMPRASLGCRKESFYAGWLQTSQLTVDQAREMIAELCRNFYSWGWVSGTGGGISIKAKDGSIVMAPSGVQKERMEPDDMFVLDSEGAGANISAISA